MSASDVRELPGGVVHWATPHPRIGQVVHSYYVEPAAALIDPMAGAGLDAALEGRTPPERVLLTCRHHLRGSKQIVDTYDGVEVLCSEHGLHEFSDADPEVAGFAWGEAVAPGIVAHEAGAICPDDAVLHVDHGPGYLAFGDGLIRWNGELALVPDFLMDDPDEVRRGMVDAVERLGELRFEGVLLAHGEPTAREGRSQLRAFADDPAQASFAT